MSTKEFPTLKDKLLRGSPRVWRTLEERWAIQYYRQESSNLFSEERNQNPDYLEREFDYDEYGDPSEGIRNRIDGHTQVEETSRYLYKNRKEQEQFKAKHAESIEKQRGKNPHLLENLRQLQMYEKPEDRDIEYAELLPLEDSELTERQKRIKELQPHIAKIKEELETEQRRKEDSRNRGRKQRERIKILKRSWVDAIKHLGYEYQPLNEESNGDIPSDLIQRIPEWAQATVSRIIGVLVPLGLYRIVPTLIADFKEISVNVQVDFYGKNCESSLIISKNRYDNEFWEAYTDRQKRCRGEFVSFFERGSIGVFGMVSVEN